MQCNEALLSQESLEQCVKVWTDNGKYNYTCFVATNTYVMGLVFVYIVYLKIHLLGIACYLRYYSSKWVFKELYLPLIYIQICIEHIVCYCR